MTRTWLRVSAATLKPTHIPEIEDPDAFYEGQNRFFDPDRVRDHAPRGSGQSAVVDKLLAVVDKLLEVADILLEVVHELLAVVDELLALVHELLAVVDELLAVVDAVLQALIASLKKLQETTAGIYQKCGVQTQTASTKFQPM